MKNFSRNSLVRSCLASAAVTIFSVAPAFSAATATVNITFSNISTGVFRYDVSVTNTGDETISIISINDAPMDEPIIGDSLMSPAFFAASYDPGVGVIDFLEDTSAFEVGTTVSGFSFQSTAAPGTAFNDLSGFSDMGNPVTVTTVLVPEPTASMLAALGLLSMVARRRR